MLWTRDTPCSPAQVASTSGRFQMEDFIVVIFVTQAGSNQKNRLHISAQIIEHRGLVKRVLEKEKSKEDHERTHR